MKTYHYFVSYQYIREEDRGFGQVNLRLKQPIAGDEQIEDVRKYIEERFGFAGVVLMNFIMLKEEEEAAIG